MSDDSPQWQPVIGLEIHVQLLTRTKLLCGDAIDFNAPPNTRVCPVCLGLPGALPVLNQEAVRLAVRAAVALGCTVHECSSFERKNYFYPDLPKGYQITQFAQPFATGGALTWADDSPRVRIRRVHLEEDAGRSLHDRYPQRTAIDLNRAGVPLVEIVTEPDLHDPAAARSFLNRLKRVLEYLEVSDCDMEKGSIRVDANVSIRRPDEPPLGVKTEIKNLNSFGNVERALRYELTRQMRIRDAGGEVSPETLTWDADAGAVRSLRGKEETEEYRYFQEPDLPPLRIAREDVRGIEGALPELPAARERRFRDQLGLPAYDADVLTAEREVADYFERVAAACGDPKAASNWVMTEVLAWRNERPAPAGFPLPPERLAQLVEMVRGGRISTRVGRLVFAEAAATSVSPADIVSERELAQVSSPGELRQWIDEVLGAHAEQVTRYRGGEDRLLDFFMGKVMRASAGRADPQRVAELLRDALR